MVDETEQKIIDAALKMFAEKGYVGATTRLIADKSGFTEVTLYRKFKTKDNLFRSVLNHYNVKMMNEVSSIFVANEFANKREFLETLVHNLVELGENNFDFIKITINERSRISGHFITEFVDGISKYIAKNIENSKIDYRIFAFSILSFIYFLILDYGNTFPDPNKAIDNYINNILTDIQ
jgi:AcrR family transcriptional regulator